MPKNSNNQSPLDKLAAEMETQAQVETQAASKPETTQETAAQEQTEVQEQSKAAYTPAQGEKHLYHVELEKPFFDKRTGKRLSTPTVQKFTETEFKALTGKRDEKDKSNAEMLGYTVKVLWNPKENI